MEKYQLGPNGGLLYCLEYLDANVDWLLKKLDERPDTYVLFDFPGQVPRRVTALIPRLRRLLLIEDSCNAD